MKMVIDNIVSPKQSAFTPGRNITDSILMINEVLDLAKIEKRSCMALKVDYEKAYDSVSCNYRRFLLNKIGFGLEWMSWIEAVVFNSLMSVLVNESAKEGFKVEIGLRQGDPLSHFLFFIVMEG
ncbi:unnamed protein product [Vicia faba]|uniref:Reverse transcriptase domain-containing protein n=1 Tax=Vicia faba TaxID=3906 RepID=A0AAV0ZRS9_VICFA|nr:unnamed protein product [Vicia faba]